MRRKFLALGIFLTLFLESNQDWGGSSFSPPPGTQSLGQIVGDALDPSPEDIPSSNNGITIPAASAPDAAYTGQIAVMTMGAGPIQEY